MSKIVFTKKEFLDAVEKARKTEPFIMTQTPLDNIIIWDEVWPFPNYHKHQKTLEEIKAKQQEEFKKIFKKSRALHRIC